MSNSSTKFFSRENNNKRHIGASVKRDHEKKIMYLYNFYHLFLKVSMVLKQNSVVVAMLHTLETS